MSGVRFTMTTPWEVDLSAATAKTVFQGSAAQNHRFTINELRVMFKGTTVTNEPVTVEEVRIGTAGTGTSGTPYKRFPDDSESIETAFVYNCSVEPNVLAVLAKWYIHPTSGIVQPLPIDKPLPVPGGNMWGIRVTADDAVSCMVHIEAEE